jgi:hypothetical protein
MPPPSGKGVPSLRVLRLAPLAVLAAVLPAQDRSARRDAAVDALIETFQDIWATDLERDEAGDRLTALGSQAARRVAEVMLAELRERRSSRLVAVLGAMRGAAEPAVPLLVAAVDDRDRFIQGTALDLLGTIAPYVRGFDPASIAEPDPGGVAGPWPGRPSSLHEGWRRLQLRCAVPLDAPLADLIARIDVTALELAEADMVVEILAARGPLARDALPALRSLRDRAREGYRSADGRSSGIDLAFYGRVAGAVVRLAPRGEDSWPDYQHAVLGSLMGYVPEVDRLLALRTLADSGGRQAVPAARHWIEHWTSDRLGLAALQALERVGPAAVDALAKVEEIAASEARDPVLRKAAARAAAAIRAR